jgi:hypothetical protein
MKIISLGCGCDVRAFLNRNNFSDKSYPFDWIFSNIDFIIQTFEKDYFEFTECEKLNAVWDPPHTSTYIYNNGCKGKTNRICSAVSLHDADHLNKEQYESFIPFINEKYKRRFNRLYNVLKSGEDVIFIREARKSQTAVNIVLETNKKFNHLMNIFVKKFKSKITLCVIDVDNIIDRNDYLHENIKVFQSFDEVLTYLHS